MPISFPPLKAKGKEDDESQDGVPKKAKTEVDTDFRNLAPGKGLHFVTNGDVEILNGPFDRAKICYILNCSFYQRVPCTIGATNGMFKGKMFDVCCDEDAERKKLTLNKLATKKLGEQVFGGELYGNILVTEAPTM